MIYPEIETTVSTVVKLKGKRIEDVLGELSDLAHDVLINLSVHRQKNDLPDDIYEDLESGLCRILDYIED